MSFKRFIILHGCCCFMLVAAGCRSETGNSQQSNTTTTQQQSSSTTQQQQSSSTQTSAANSNGAQVAQNVSAQNSNVAVTGTAQKFDPCSLLTRAEIESVQGEEVRETKTSPGNSPRMAVSQCFYQTATPVKSVSLEVTQRLSGQPGALSPREFWEERFERDEHDKERERGREKKREADKSDARAVEEEEEGPPPRRVAGVGDEAFWVGSPIMGALYVLKGNSIIRISVGGVANQNTRLEKSKTLAQAALQRLKG
jgi:hypothetical protein